MNKPKSMSSQECSKIILNEKTAFFDSKLTVFSKEVCNLFHTLFQCPNYTVTSQLNLFIEIFLIAGYISTAEVYQILDLPANFCGKNEIKLILRRNLKSKM